MYSGTKVSISTVSKTMLYTYSVSTIVSNINSSSVNVIKTVSQPTGVGGWHSVASVGPSAFSSAASKQSSQPSLIQVVSTQPLGEYCVQLLGSSPQ